jgi:hypothetical protein
MTMLMTPKPTTPPTEPFDLVTRPSNWAAQVVAKDDLDLLRLIYADTPAGRFLRDDTTP